MARGLNRHQGANSFSTSSLRRLLLGATCLASTVIAVAQPSFAPIPPGVKSYNLDGFSVTAPNGPDWYVLQSASRAITFLKKLPPDALDQPPMAATRRTPRTFFVQIGVLDVGTANSSTDEALSNMMKRESETQTSPGLDLKQFQSYPRSVRGWACLGYDAVYEGYHIKLQVPVVMLNHGYVCRYPYKEGFVISALRSERSQRGANAAPDSPYILEADASLNSILLYQLH